MNRRTATIGLAATALGMASRVNAQAKDKVRFTLTGTSMLYMPIYVADAMGYFADERITPEISGFKAGGAAALAAVIGGNMDIYVGAASSAIRSVQQGADAVLIAATVTRYSIDIVLRKDIADQRKITDKSTEIERYKALKGLRIGVSGSGSGTHQIAQYALTRAGLNPERDATIVFLGDSASSLAAFAAKRVDAITGSSPASEMAVRDHGGMLLIDGPGNGYSELDGFLYVALISTNKWTKANPELTTRAVRAFARAHKAMRDPKLTYEARDKAYAKTFSESDKTLYDAAWERIVLGVPPNIAMNDGQIERVVKFLNEFSSDKYSADPAKVYTNRFVEAAAAVR